MLSKSTILKGAQCEKHLWLYTHHPEWQDPISRSRQAVIDTGHRVGEMAHQLFPGGFHATTGTGRPSQQTAELTRQKIEAGETVLYEATFIHNQVLVAVDILVKTPTGWHIHEVKSSSGVKDYHYLDAAVQWWVLAGCGLPLDDVFITHIDTSYLKHGEIEVHKLFRSESVKDRIRQLLPDIPGYVERFGRLVHAGSEPGVDIGPFCEKPFLCPYKSRCWQHIPENSVFDIGGLKSATKFDLYYKSVVHLNDLRDTASFSGGYRIQIESFQQDREYIDPDAIRALLDQLAFPLYFLDFEGIFGLAIPIYDQTHPFQQVPFQFSLHVKESFEAEPEHFEFLAEPGPDPRTAFIKELLHVIGTRGSIIVYNKTYEGSVLGKIAEQFPRYAERISPLHDRIWDLMVIFQKKYYYNPRMKGSYSIKDVLPAVVPGLGYGHLDIRDGEMASAKFLKMVRQEETDKPYDEIHKDLLEYCKLDTLAMVRLVDELVKRFH